MVNRPRQSAGPHRLNCFDRKMGVRHASKDHIRGAGGVAYMARNCRDVLRELGAFYTVRARGESIAET